MDYINLIIEIVEFIAGLVFFYKFFCGVTKSSNIEGVFWCIVFLWVMYELSEIDIAFGFDALDMIFVLGLFIFLIWANRSFMQNDILLREADKIIEKLNDKNYKPTAEELERQCGFLSQQEKDDIKIQYTKDNFKFILKIILTYLTVAIIAGLICYLCFSKIDVNKLQLIMSIVVLFAIYVLVIAIMFKSLNSEDVELRNTAKKDLPYIVLALLIVFVGAFAILYFGVNSFNS